MKSSAFLCHLPLCTVLLSSGAVALCGCGNHQEAPPPPEAQGPCAVQIQSWPEEGQQHVAEGTPLQFGSNPPSSGNHYPIWGRWGVHEKPLERGYYVHNLEHGGIVLLYRCADSCSDVVAELQSVLHSRPADPACAPEVSSRIVLTADPLLDVPVAAAAWGHTYRGQCLDRPLLNDFIEAHYDKAPESTCVQGFVPFFEK